MNKNKLGSKAFRTFDPVRIDRDSPESLRRRRPQIAQPAASDFFSLQNRKIGGFSLRGFRIRSIWQVCDYMISKLRERVLNLASHILSRLSIATAAALVAACGGGSGPSPSFNPPANPTVPGYDLTLGTPSSESSARAALFGGLFCSRRRSLFQP